MLPIPESRRLQPLRLGLIGIWEYGVQEFVFHGGRLILRGRNGSGKTKVMEATSPLLLDAILSARRLDPFGTTARTMQDNLLHRGRKHRVGYSWCEYGRITDDGTHEFVTIGIGMRASTSHKEVLHKPWFFVTSQRVGQDFQLLNEHGQPLLRKHLELLLEPNSVFAERKQYRTAVAERLFGFSAARMASLVELLLTLRRPKLSENFDGVKLSRMLGSSLPPVSTVLLDELAVRFDQLTRDRNDLEQQERHREAMRSFLSVYRRFARRWTRWGAQELTKAEQQLTGARMQYRKAVRELGQAKEELERTRIRRGQLDATRKGLQVTIGELRAGPLMEQHGLLTALQDQAIAAEERLPGLEERLAAAQTAAGKATEAAGGQARLLTVSDKAVTAAEERSLERSAHTRIEDAHRQYAAVIRSCPQEAETSLQGHAQVRARVLEEAVKRAEMVRQAQADYNYADQQFQSTLKRWNRSKQAASDREAALGGHISALRAQLADWSDRCGELRLSEAELTDLHLLVPTFGLPGVPVLSQELARLARPRHLQLAAAAAALESEQNHAVDEHKTLSDERKRVAKERDPLPPAPLHHRRKRAGLSDGAPLWRLLEFAPGLSLEAKTGLEAALLGAGVLDAWVTSGGAVLNGQTMDTLLSADHEPVPGPSLADVLQPVEHPAVPTGVTTAILTALALAAPDGPPPQHDWVATDGSWRIGPVHGRTSVKGPAYIGAAAREAERQRRLNDLDQQLGGINARILELEGRLETARERQDVLTAECDDAADLDQPLRQGQQDLATARSVFEAHDKQRQEEEANRVELDTALREVRNALDRYAREQATATDLVALAAEQSDLQEYRASLEELFRKVANWRHRAEQSASAHLLAAAQELHRDQVDADRLMAVKDAEAKREQYDVRLRLVGADVAVVLAELATKQTQLSEAEELEKVNQEAADQARDTAAHCQAAHEQASELVTQRTASLDAQSGNYRKLEQLGFTALAGGAEPKNPDESTPERAVREYLTDSAVT
ncbi:TIGR02680 family protein [Kitasatospora sp. NPDC059795]|uniref:TIGR02680 family protein n=1 Tax=Kitasatospora sp. NPDC059795 TaxID=3346949 RepID=UPI0036688583